MPFQGSLVSFDRLKGFGFVPDPDGSDDDIFVHVNDVAADDRESLVAGSLIEFEIVDGDKGPRAIKVVVLEANTALLSTSAYRHEVTDLLLDVAGSVTGDEIKRIRDGVVELAVVHGWLD